VHIQGVSFDPGDPLILNEFVRRRQTDRSRVIRFTDTLVRGFGLNNRLVSRMRSKALSLFDRSLLAKRALSAIASGGQEGGTRLARGLTLTEWDLG
jgi:2-polyprenyl-6-methoxyphenol hydroxylase-like FAD-dependent oxidoreductase